MVLIQTDYTAWRFGSNSKFVCCEKCGTEFAYTMFREASGHGTSLYFLDEAGAEQRAKGRAESKVQRALANEVDPVECPQCGCFQTDMVREARRRYLKWMGPWYAIVALIIVMPIFFCGGGYLNATFTAFPIVPWRYLIFATIGLAATIVLMPFVRYFLSLRYDPHRDSPSQRIARGYGLGVPLACYQQMMAEMDKRTGGASASNAKESPENASMQIFDASAKRPAGPVADTVFKGIPLSQLFGRELNSDEIENFRRSMSEAPAVDQSEKQFVYLSWKNHGLVFEFNFGKMDFIFLYAEGFEGYSQYLGELPFGLVYSDTRADVERKLGKPDVVDNVDGIIPVQATYKDKGVKLSYVSKDLNDQTNRIGSVGIFPVGLFK